MILEWLRYVIFNILFLLRKLLIDFYKFKDNYCLIEKKNVGDK